MSDKEYDVENIVNSVVAAIEKGKYCAASDSELLMIRISALENIVKSYKEIIAKSTLSVA
jgi:hypothetical protein